MVQEKQYDVSSDDSHPDLYDKTLHQYRQLTFGIDLNIMVLGFCLCELQRSQVVKGRDSRFSCSPDEVVMSRWTCRSTVVCPLKTKVPKKKKERANWSKKWQSCILSSIYIPIIMDHVGTCRHGTIGLKLKRNNQSIGSLGSRHL